VAVYGHIGLSTGGLRGTRPPQNLTLGGHMVKCPPPPEFQEMQLKKYNVNISDAAGLRISCLADKSDEQQIG